MIKSQVRPEGEFEIISLILKEPLELQELILFLKAHSIERGVTDQKEKDICALEFHIKVEDCTRITWQTLTVIILASISVFLSSTLAIMFSLYKQRDINGTDFDGDDDLDASDGCEHDHVSGCDESFDDDLNRRRNSGHEDTSYNLRNTNMFITPRRTSSYDSSNMSRYSNSDVIDLNETQL